MVNVALTGNVASGKSTVADRWRSVGVPVISADDLARQAVEPDSDGLRRVVDAFGEDVVTAEGRLDRGAVRDRVFQDAEARKRLEEIIHPIVWRLRDRWLEERRAEGASLTVSEIPLLFETGRESDFDLVVLVDAPEAVRIERLVEHRDLDPREARRIIESQMDAEVKRRRSDFVIDNVGTVGELEVLADRVLAQLRAAAGGESLKVDLHLHTRGSWDCLSDPEAVLERVTALGYDRIAITDHDAIGVALQMAEAHPGRIVPGEEVKTAEGIDIIGLYLSELIPGGTPADETVRRIRDQGGIPYLPHPYAGGKGAGDEEAERLAALCDVVEVFNARIHDQRLNEKADELATRHGKLRSAGSDAHTLGELGHAHVVLPAHPNDADGLRGALAHARVGGRESSRLVHLASTWAKVRKKLP